EVDLEVHTAPSNIILRLKQIFAELRGLVGRLAQIQTLQIEKECQNREQQAQAKLDREQIASLENELRNSQRAGKELEARRSQEDAAHQQHLAAERIQLAAKNSQTAELTTKLLKLNQDVKSFTEIFGLSRPGLQNSNSGAAVLIRSLFRDIRLIRKRKSLWKACRFCRSTLSREGTRDIPSNPKITAEALKQKLQGIERTLKSKKTSPKMALNALAQ